MTKVLERSLGRCKDARVILMILKHKIVFLYSLRKIVQIEKIVKDRYLKMIRKKTSQENKKE